jgi:hypothetical protein
MSRSTPFVSTPDAALRNIMNLCSLLASFDEMDLLWNRWKKGQQRAIVTSGKQGGSILIFVVRPVPTDQSFCVTLNSPTHSYVLRSRMRDRRRL